MLCQRAKDLINKWFKRGGHVNTSRENRLEELGRVDAEKGRHKKGKRNLSDEKRRIIRELRKKGGNICEIIMANDQYNLDQNIKEVESLEKVAQLQLHLKRKNQELLEKLLVKSEKNLFQLLANNMKLLQKQAKKNLDLPVLRKKVKAGSEKKEENFITLQRKNQK